VPLAIALAALAAGYLAFNTFRYVIDNYELRGEERRLRAEVDALEQDHAQLIAVRDYLKSDEYIEYVARRTLGLVRPGETLVVVSGPPAPVTPVADIDRPPGQAWWKELFAGHELPEAAPTPGP
jgi:cell division protein FtsB